MADDHDEGNGGSAAKAGIVLMASAAAAMIVANSPLADLYAKLIETPVEVRVGPLELAKPLLLWINDGLMAIFFFIIGLELKREMLEGELADRRKIILPGMAAIGGMVVPAAFYIWFNHDDPVAMQGWAIPAATDIAFALGILALLGSRVPVGLKVFLVSLAIFDDVGAIVIIAMFYTSELSMQALITALACLPILFVLNRRGVTRFMPYLFIGMVMWVALVKSGVHATRDGVLLALFIPMRDRKNPERSPLRELEHDLHGTVSFAIIPIFAFANSGISLTGVGLDYLLHSVPMGIATGLFFGKQIGVFGFAWLATKIGGKLPDGVGWKAIYGAATLCGVGFTMSLFIGSLAFEATGVNLLFDERLGIIGGSLLSGVAGYLILRWALPDPGAKGASEAA